MIHAAFSRHPGIVQHFFSHLAGARCPRELGVSRRSDRVPVHRYLAVSRRLRSAAIHYDRENPTVLHAQAVPDTATYCCYVRDSKGVFMTAHALLDPRTAGHPVRETVPAYCGVPVMDAGGEVLGTLCHYDLVPQDPEQVNIELIIQVASALAQGGQIPPFPIAKPG